MPSNQALFVTRQPTERTTPTLVSVSRQVRVTVVLPLLLTATVAHAEAGEDAQAATSPSPAEVAPPPPARKIGGHIGIATPLVTVSSKTTTISDQFTILNPIGLGFKLSEHLAVDFEMVVATPIHPTGTTGLVVDPGLIYGFGRVAAGLRLAFQINSDANVGLIPLLNVGLVDFDGATWFVEAAFPTFYADKELAFNTVLHTGIGF